MAILVNESGGNFSALSWYRSDASLLDNSGNVTTLSVTRYGVFTPSNSGTIRKAIFGISSSTNFYKHTAGQVYIALQRGRTATLSIASPGICTLTSHGFVSTKPTCTITIATPGVITATSHGLVDGDVVGFSTTGALPTGLATNASYFVINATTNTFQVSATRGGSAIDTTGSQSGTHTLWYETVQFTTTGALPTGVTANTVYFVEYINANTFYFRQTPTGARINCTGSQSGIHTSWDPKDYAFKTYDQIFSTDWESAATYLLPFTFQRGASYDTTSNGWRWMALQSNASHTFYISSQTSTLAPFFVMWGNTSATFTNGTDTPVLCAKTVIDQDLTFKGGQALVLQTQTALSFAGLICSPDVTNRAYSTDGSAGNTMLLCNGAAARTITVDGTILSGTQTGIYLGTEAAPISYANKLIVNFVAPTYAGVNSAESSFADISGGLIAAGGGITVCISGAYPTQRYATLTADAAVSATALSVDDASGFQTGDYVYISKHDITGNGSLARYQVASASGTTINLTSGILGQVRKTGGRVVLVERGYGVQFYSPSTSTYSNGFRINNPVNVFIKGLYIRNVHGVTTYAASNRFWDDVGNRRTGGMFFGYCFTENYQSSSSTTASTAVIFASITAEREGVVFDNMITVGGFMASNARKILQTPVSGTVFKTGDIEIKNCFQMNFGGASFISTASSASTSFNIHDCVSHNCSFGLPIIGTNTRHTNNYVWGATNCCYATNAYFPKLISNTFEKCSIYLSDSTPGVIILSATDDSPVFNTALTNSFSPTSDSYYDYTVFSPHGDLSAIDNTYLDTISDNSLLLVLRNNDTLGDNYWWNNTGAFTGTYTNAISIAHATLDVPGIYTSVFNGSSLYFSVAGTYNLTSGQHLGTLNLYNTSGGAVTVIFSPTVTYVNNGPSITIQIQTDTSIELSGMVSGSRVYIRNMTDSSDVYNDIVSGTTLSYPITWNSNKTMRVQITYTDSTTAFLPYETTGVLSSSGMSIVISQIPDSVYETNAIDGSTVTEYSLDGFGSLLFEVDDLDGETTVQRGYAWYCHQITTETGIVQAFGAMTALDEINYRLNVDVLNFNFKNVSIVACHITGGYIFKSDFSNLIDAASNSIFLDPGKAYITRSIASDITSIKSKTDNLPSDPASNTQVATRASQASVDSIPTNPLLDNDYTAPDNLTIAAIKKSTDLIGGLF